ncbi:M1 family metallopeptidase [Agriterribacter sp.]|uniref:M1 family metallopeptidase n=1 Tax=Agriterribacter sp. TaxID=2821509 RepID=UPI002C3144D8|nr:M1 family metallopeptidase [Agriterribacter sp.]HRP57778.1 M1 family metallopeptidase [Agriterribacter sp.]
MNRILFVAMFLCGYTVAFSQPDRWQQKVKYVMDIDMNVQTNRFDGKQKLEYWNNSPDTLHKVFYHLYWNAFQPNSMMDARSRELGNIEFRGRNNQVIKDWDARVTNRIQQLKPEETGYQKIVSLKMNGVAQPYKVYETILEVQLSKPVLPKSKVVFDMEFEAQVPLQIRRAGRDNPNTGVRYSMSQWYPKLCEYDYEGWHPTPYVAREFYGVWGDYEVNITLDKNYIIGGTGYLQNASQIGYGYESKGAKVTRPSGNTLTWRFTAPNVHDFVWAADPQFKHIKRHIPGGPTIHVLYKNKPGDTANDGAWNEVADAAVTVLPFIEKHFGAYPYKQYSFIHGGDGGMEYPMATLISGPGLGTAFHEWMHSWYQMMLGTNESLYAWMDEGFTTYAEDLVSAYYKQQKSNPVKGNELSAAPSGSGAGVDLPLYHADTYAGYFNLVKSGLEEPLTTHADHFNTNFAYARAAYSKGGVFLAQLGYIISDSLRDKTLLEYYNQWKFKHPNANDFMRVAEKVSGIQLDWYKEYWVNTTKTIDYKIDSLWEQGGKTKIRLRMAGQIPMPLDVLLQYKNGTKATVYIPQFSMFGEKPAENTTPRFVQEPWKWTHPTYVFEVESSLMNISSVEIDPTWRMADINRSNNKLELKW